MRAVLNTFQPESTRIKASPKRENLIKTKDQYRLPNFFQNLFQYLQIGDAVLLFGMNLIWTSILDSLRRRVRPSIPQLVSITLALTGMILVTKPSFIFSFDDSVQLANAAEDDTANFALGQGMALSDRIG